MEVKAMKFLKPVIGIIIFSLCAISITAQDKEVKKEKEIRLKIVKETDGEKIEIDTVISGDVDFDKEAFLKMHNIEIDSDDELVKRIEKKYVVEIDEDDTDGKKMMFIHTNDDGEVKVKHIEGDSVVWHNLDEDGNMSKHIVIDIDEESKEGKKIKVIKMGDEEEIIIKEIDGDEDMHWHMKHDKDGTNKKIEVKVEVDGEVITIEEIETDEEGKKEVKKKKVKKKK